MFLQGQSKIIREGDRGTLASALIFSAKPLTDNNAEVKSLESRGGGTSPFLGLGWWGRGSPSDPSSGVTTESWPAWSSAKIVPPLLSTLCK